MVRNQRPTTEIRFGVEEGVVEIRDPRLFRLGRESFCQSLIAEAIRPGLAKQVEIRLESASCRLEFEPGKHDRDELARMAASALKAASIASNDRKLADGSTLPAPVEPRLLAIGSGSTAESKRMVNLALAGGSFAMVAVGVVLPGIPALPFLLLTGHYLVKSSPVLCRRLATLPGIGVLLEKVGQMAEPSFNRRSLLKTFGLTVAAVAAFVVLHPPLPVVILLEVGVMAYYGLRSFGSPIRAALPWPSRARIALVA